MNDILTRLQNGESIDDIAAEFTKALNEASATYEAEVKAKKEAEAAAAKKAVADAHKIDILKEIAALFNEYITAFHPDFTLDGKTVAEVLSAEDLTDEDYLEMSEAIDSFIELAGPPLFSMMAPTTNLSFVKKKDEVEPKTTVEKVPGGVKITGKGPLTEKELDNIFTDFFKTYKF